MTMKMKKLMIAGMLALGACGMLAGCGGGDKAASSAAKAASGKPAKIVAGMDDTFAPMGFRDDSGKIVGFDIDMAEAVSKEIGVPIEFKPIDWDAKEIELESGTIDCVWNGMTMTPERTKKLAFTKPYMDNIQVYAVLNDSAIKTPEEIKNLTVACDIASRAFEKIIKDIRPGVTEKEIASRLAHYMVMEGADTKPYGGIVISGAKSSLLHGIPDSKPIEYGDFVLMDYGCQYKGYLSDMTRTVVVGKADAKQREVYDLCRRMTEDTEASVRAGVTGTSCYEASLEAIKDTEYLPYNYTGIGHGVGLFVHELPNIGLNCENILQENSIMTVEPGLYIPGWGSGHHHKRRI